MNLTTGDVVLEHIEIAETFWQRFWGLQFRSELSTDTGLMLSPCSSLHTCFMRFPIDVIMLGRDDAVIGLRRDVLPWRVVLCEPGTCKVIETRVGAVELPTGTRLRFF